jgi:16S rRNA U516 pseudouridylate synthase RsuA-like enzyme
MNMDQGSTTTNMDQGSMTTNMDQGMENEGTTSDQGSSTTNTTDQGRMPHQYRAKTHQAGFPVQNLPRLPLLTPMLRNLPRKRLRLLDPQEPLLLHFLDRLLCLPHPLPLLDRLDRLGPPHRRPLCCLRFRITAKYLCRLRSMITATRLSRLRAGISMITATYLSRLRARISMMVGRPRSFACLGSVT